MFLPPTLSPGAKVSVQKPDHGVCLGLVVTTQIQTGTGPKTEVIADGTHSPRKLAMSPFQRQWVGSCRG